ncbi:MarR family transcriptional regulator [Microvirga sp. W0021]|uniref:MarR family transcriptional regulator n=1 Tax=Hohaiivirga grylli TaxID=3133970 RepID=A0ABV0BG36_9HYPH
METTKQHYEGCTRAFRALAEAHTIIATEIERALSYNFRLSLNEFDTLVCLDNQPQKSAPLSSLAQRIHLSQPAISRLVDRLDKRNLIAKIGCTEDKRSLTIQLTEEGCNLLVQAIPIHDQCIREKLLKHLSHEENEILRLALIRVIEENAAQTER